MGAAAVEIRVFTDALPDAATVLAGRAHGEGHAHMRRLVDEWSDGSNRFLQRGERLVGAYSDDALIGIGGLTLELSRTDWLRMRRFYVHPDHRKRGVGRKIAGDLLAHARGFTDVITLHAVSEEAAAFWQALGFRPCLRDSYTHVLAFRDAEI